MKSFVCFITLIAVALAAGNVYIGRKSVINSELSIDGETPYLAFIINYGPYIDYIHGTKLEPTCTGTIISPTAVLTAALCCPLNHSGFYVQAGYRADTDWLTYDSVFATYSTRHEGFRAGVRPYNNLCIIHLDKPLTFSKHIKPAALPIPGAIPAGVAVLSGFGAAKDPYSGGSSLPMRATLQIISINECGNELASETPQGIPVVLKENSGVICTSNKQVVKGCVFDIGGPLVQNGVLIGVVSHTYRFCGAPNSPPVYTDVSHYVYWINRQTTKDLPGTKEVDTEVNKEGWDLQKFVDELFKQLGYYLS